MIETTRVEVVNLHYQKCDVRIDRATPWGNPFKIDRNTSRSEVIEKYRRWIAKRPHLVEALAAEVEEKGGRLGCWCAPQRCHGDVLVELLEE